MGLPAVPFVLTSAQQRLCLFQSPYSWRMPSASYGVYKKTKPTSCAESRDAHRTRTLQRLRCTRNQLKKHWTGSVFCKCLAPSSPPVHCDCPNFRKFGCARKISGGNRLGLEAKRDRRFSVGHLRHGCRGSPVRVRPGVFISQQAKSGASRMFAAPDDGARIFPPYGIFGGG